MSVNPIPATTNRVIPYVVIDRVEAALEFTQAVFGAEVVESISNPAGSIVHAEIKIGESCIMFGAKKGELAPCMLYVYVADTDATYQHALELGAQSLMEPVDEFYGDRNAGVKDSQGITWWIASRIEEVSEEEMARRSKEWPRKNKPESRNSPRISANRLSSIQRAVRPSC